MLKLITRHRPIWAATGDGAAGADAASAAVSGAAPGAAAAAAAPAAAAASKWFQGAEYAAEEQAWLAAKGLAEDDPLKALPKLVKGHRQAEQRIGKGLDSIMDRPAKDQPLAAWLKGNASTLGLPDKEEGYAAEPPQDWPKDLKWDGDFEARARKLAFDSGVPPEVHKAYVGMFAEHMKAMAGNASVTLDAARATMMTDLQRDFGDQTDAVIHRARQAAQFAATEAGLPPEAIANIGALLGKAGGDAATIRLFAAIGKAMGEDNAVALNRQGSLTMTPAEARAELARFTSPEGEYGQAFAKNDLRRMNELRARRDQLAKLAV